MEKKRDWLLHLATGLFLAALLTIVIWVPASRGLCPTEKVLEATASQNCLDFLLNRYQTGLGALATIAAGVVAWLAVQRQIASDRDLALRPQQEAKREIDTILRFVVGASREMACQLRLNANSGPSETYNAALLIDGWRLQVANQSMAKLDAYKQFLGPTNRRQLDQIRETVGRLDGYFGLFSLQDPLHAAKLYNSQHVGGAAAVAQRLDFLVSEIGTVWPSGSDVQ